jgi:hypothetical protein
MKKLIPFILLLFFFHVVDAQKQKPKLISINQVGVAWGGSDQDLQLQTINGIFYKTFSAGIGVGLDYYWQRTVPVFIDLRKDLFTRDKTPFVYADLGVNMPWVKTKEQTWYKSDYHSGSYFDIGIGYKMKVYKKFSANLSFGYTQKVVKEERTSQVIMFDSFRYDENGLENYKYTLRRFSVKAGLSF